MGSEHTQTEARCACSVLGRGGLRLPWERACRSCGAGPGCVAATLLIGNFNSNNAHFLFTSATLQQSL